LRDLRTLDRKIADLNGRIEAEVEASGTTLTQIFGIGPILAARIIGTVGDVGRFPTKSHFASYCGTAPLEASSGEAVRHRLSLAGNRHLNYALHMVAVCQARSDARGCYELDEKRLRNAGNGDREGTEPTVESAFLCDFRPSP
jgi:transposase